MSSLPTKALVKLPGITWVMKMLSLVSFLLMIQSSHCFSGPLHISSQGGRTAEATTLTRAMASRVDINLGLYRRHFQPTSKDVVIMKPTVNAAAAVTRGKSTRAPLFSSISGDESALIQRNKRQQLRLLLQNVLALQLRTMRTGMAVLRKNARILWTTLAFSLALWGGPMNHQVPVAHAAPGDSSTVVKVNKAKQGKKKSTLKLVVVGGAGAIAFQSTKKNMDAKKVKDPEVEAPSEPIVTTTTTTTIHTEDGDEIVAEASWSSSDLEEATDRVEHTSIDAVDPTSNTSGDTDEKGDEGENETVTMDTQISDDEDDDQGGEMGTEIVDDTINVDDNEVVNTNEEEKNEPKPVLQQEENKESTDSVADAVEEEVNDKEDETLDKTVDEKKDEELHEEIVDENGKIDSTTAEQNSPKQPYSVMDMFKGSSKASPESSPAASSSGEEVVEKIVKDEKNVPPQSSDEDADEEYLTSVVPLSGSQQEKARMQPKSTTEEKALADKYAAIPTVEERAYQILVDLGMVLF